MESRTVERLLCLQRAASCHFEAGVKKYRCSLYLHANMQISREDPGFAELEEADAGPS